MQVLKSQAAALLENTGPYGFSTPLSKLLYFLRRPELFIPPKCISTSYSYCDKKLRTGTGEWEGNATVFNILHIYRGMAWV